MAEKKQNKKPETYNSTILILLIVILIGVVIAIPIVYSTGRTQGLTQKLIVPDDVRPYVDNECTRRTRDVEALYYISNSEPFPYQLKSFIYRPSVILKQISLVFGFRHDVKSWSIDKISVIDTTTGSEIMKDGGFESNYLYKNYQPVCILSNSRSSFSDIYFDLPYEGDFYYGDQTVVGMAYLIQDLNIFGGRYYNISFYLENRGYAPNYFVLLVAP